MVLNDSLNSAGLPCANTNRNRLEMQVAILICQEAIWTAGSTF